MFLKHLELRHFRNLAPQRITFDTPVTVIRGRNGQGKTSLLEAIYLLSHTKSFRTAKLSEVLAWDVLPGFAKEFGDTVEEMPVAVPASNRGGEKKQAHIQAVLSTESGDRELLLQIGKAGRSILVNGNPLTRSSDFFGEVLTVAFTPETLQLVRGGPQTRRAFLDRVLAMVDSRYVESAVRYHQAIKHRNALLGRRAGRPVESSELQVWDALLVKHGREVATRRSEFVSQLTSLVPAAYREIVGDIAEEIQIGYLSDFINPDGTIRSEESLFLEFQQRIDRDLRIGSTGFGVHRDELPLTMTFQSTGYQQVTHSSTQQDARSGASQGQARSIALAMTFAALDFLEMRTGEPPIVLLDDVESELDQERRAAMFRRVGKRKNQVFLSTTDASPHVYNDQICVSYMSVEKGHISPTEQGG